MATKILIVFAVFFGFAIGLYLFASFLGSWRSSDGKFYVASKLKGQLISPTGKNVAGIEVKRRIHWRDEKSYQTTKTDDNGHFVFEEKLDTSLSLKLMSVLPGETTIGHKVSANIDGKDLELIYISKRNLKEHGELGEYADNEKGEFVFKPHPADLICNIDKEPGHTNQLQVYGVCEERTPGPKTKLEKET